MIRIVIVSDKDTERGRIRAFLVSQLDFKILGEGKDGYELLKLVCDLKPDIALVDERLPFLDRTDIIPVLKRRSPETGAIILASYSENHQVLKAISEGASGCLLKDSGQDRFIAGIRTVYNGGSLMTPEIALKAFMMFRNEPRDVPLLPAPFTNLPRIELQVTKCIAKGLSNKEIAAKLCFKEGTVRNYITAVFQRTGLKNRTQVALRAREAGFRAEE
jgi:DNA-binding NarL/FixJ family response regulator